MESVDVAIIETFAESGAEVENSHLALDMGQEVFIISPTDDNIKPRPTRKSPKTEKAKAREIPDIAYSKLVVPVTMRSVYWQGFGFPADEEGSILSREKVICLFCRTSIMYNQNTSNLRMHLESRHHDKLLEFEANAIHTKKGQRQVDKHQHLVTTYEQGTTSKIEHIFETFSPTPLSTKRKRLAAEPSKSKLSHYPNSVEIIVPSYGESSTEVTPPSLCVESAITEYLITDLISPSAINGVGFKKLITTMCPDVTDFQQSRVADQLLPHCSEVLRMNLHEELSSLSGFAVSLEEWSSNGKTFVTMNVHFIRETKSEFRVLSTLEMPLDKNKWSTLILDTMLAVWGIRTSQVSAVVVGSSNPELLDGLENHDLKVIPCIDYTLQASIKKCLGSEQVRDILATARLVYQRLGNKLTEIGGQTDVPESSINFPEHWISIYYLLALILENQESIREQEKDQPSSLSEEDFQKIQVLTDILKPFSVMFSTLQEENSPSVSLMLPFLYRVLISHVNESDSDDEFTSHLKSILRADLSRCYCEEKVHLLLNIATYLDPRFKTIPLAADNNAMVMADIKGLMKNMDSTTADDVTALPARKMAKVSSINLLLGGICPENNEIDLKEQRVQLELTMYQSEASAAMESCPMEWWATTGKRCPTLFSVARTFLCIPASCVPSSRLLLNKRGEFHFQRSALNPDFIDLMLFLHGNRGLLSFQL